MDDLSYFIAASSFYRQWGCRYKAHETFRDANAFKVELTPIPSRPTTPHQHSSSSSGTTDFIIELIQVGEYDVFRLDLRAALQ